jgi:hypothetical protein
MIRPLDGRRPVIQPEVLPDVEQSVVLAHEHAPVLRITGVIRSIQRPAGPRRWASSR